MKILEFDMFGEDIRADKTKKSSEIILSVLILTALPVN